MTQQSLKILHIVHQYPPESVGGTELYTQSLAEQQIRAGHSVAIFTPASASTAWPEPRHENGLRIYRYPTGKRTRQKVFFDSLNSPQLVDAFTEVLTREQPTLVHGQHFMGLPASISQKITQAGFPLVLTIHDYWYGCANAQLITNYDHAICRGPDSLYYNCGRCAIARVGLSQDKFLAPSVAPMMAYRNRKLNPILRSADRVIFPSSFTESIYRDLGLTDDKSVVVPHGIEQPGFKPKSSENKTGEESAADPSGSALAIGYVGSLAWQKGVHILVEALNGLPDSSVTCDIYGSLTHDPEYSDRLKKISRHPAVTFHGQLERGRFWSTLASLDVLVFPTLWYESFGLVIQEAFAAGLPVIGSRIGAVEEHIRHGIDGLLFTPGDVSGLRAMLEELAENPGKLSDLKSGIPPVRSLEDHSADIAGIYASVLDRAINN